MQGPTAPSFGSVSHPTYDNAAPHVDPQASIDTVPRPWVRCTPLYDADHHPAWSRWNQ